jgi:hypothetical protein
LTNIEQLSNLVQQFPHVNYLELINPLDETLFTSYLKILFSLNENKFKLWSQLIHLTIYLVFPQLNYLWNDNTLFDWIIENTDLKYYQKQFYVRYLRSKISIWF